MVTKDLLLLLTVFGGFQAGFEAVAADGNKEHVHIKVHVPQLIKKHTHVRTVYKHHFKAKPKYSPKSKTKYYKHPPPSAASSHHTYYDDPPPSSPSSASFYERRDPAIRHGTLHSKFQRGKWMDQLLPAASHLHEERSTSEQNSASSDSGQEPDILQRWQHNFKLLNRKPAPPKRHSSKAKAKSKRRPTAPPYVPAFESAEFESAEPTSTPGTLDFGFANSYTGERHSFFQDPAPPKPNLRPTSQKLSAVPKPTPKPAPKPAPKQQQSKQPKHRRPVHKQLDQSIPTNHSPQHRPSTSVHGPYPNDFKPPRLLKITEEDIRSHNGPVKSKNSPYRHVHPYGSGSVPNDGPTVVAGEWADYATEKPSSGAPPDFAGSVQQTYPEYIQAVAAALQYSRPPPTGIDYEQLRFGAPLVQQMTPPPPVSQEEFMPFRSSAPLQSANGKYVMNYAPLEVPAFDGAEHEDDNADDDHDNHDVGVEEAENGHQPTGAGGYRSNERGLVDGSAEFGPTSFDEVPYQTFTKRKNLLRNAHRD